MQKLIDAIPGEMPAPVADALGPTLLARIMNANPVPCFVIDAEHRVILWNRGCEQVLGIGAAEMLGTREHWRPFYTQPRSTLADLIVDGKIDSATDRLYVDKKLQRSASIPGAYEARDFFPGLGESGRWLAFTAAPILDRQGKLIAAVETLQDVTEQCRVEAALQRSHDRLEQEVAMRTAELAESNRKLAASLKQAEEINRLKSAFLSILSHELKTPLNGVIGLSELILLNPQGDETADFARLIHQSGETLFRHVDEMLRLAELDAGIGEVSVVPSSPRDLLEAIVQPFAGRAADKGIAIEQRVAAALPDILLIDAKRLSKAVGAVVDNAIKFTDSGRIEIVFSRTQGDLVVTVSDTGRGIAPEFQPRVFDRFSQAEAHNVRHEGGLGIGLALAKAQAEMLGGELALRSSELGKGSCFVLRLPAEMSSCAQYSAPA